MKYPSRSDYFSSIRNPQFAFRKKDPRTLIERDLDSSLIAGKAVERIKPDGTREIWSASGSFAIAFKYETFSPRKVWAIRCFYRSNFDAINHYKKALSRLKNNACHSYFVDFSLLEEGIRVLGNVYPILKMEWVEGENLKKILKANLGKKHLLKSLADRWLKLSQDFLESGIAHGDLQHGNILIVNRFDGLTLKLIDYDSLYFSGDTSDDNIKGLSDYQHPLRKSLEKRCLEIDFFSQLVIYLSILALAEDKKLWEMYRLDEREGLLFSRSDFQNPQQAEIFKSLSHLSAPLPTLAKKLKTICQVKEFRKIPSLARVLSNDESIVLHRREDLSEKLNLNSPSPINPLLLWQKGKDWLSRNTSHHTGKERLISALDTEQKSEEKTEEILAPELRSPTPSSNKALRWDPRPYKASSPQTQILVNSPPTESKTAIEKKADNFLSWVEKTRGDLQQTSTLAYRRGIEQFQAFQLKLTDALEDLIERLKTQLEPKTWTTHEIASQLGCSATWCHRQRYRFSDRFCQGTHYFKDDEGAIRWTKAGIRQLHCLHSEQKADPIPPSSLPTKEVSRRMKVTPEWIIQTKAKYSSQFIEGSHYYYIDARKRYYWTSEGIACLQQLLLAYPPKSSQSKTKRGVSKKRRINNATSTESEN